MGNYLLLILSAFMFSSQIIFSKRYQQKQGNTFYASTCFSLITAIVCLIYTLIINGFRINFEWYSFFMAIAFSSVHVVSRLISLKTLSLGKVSIYTLFLMLGGMIVPFVYGALFLDEEVKITYVIATALLIIALVIPTLNFKKGGEKTEKPSLIFLLLCTVIFLLNGIGSTIAKVHQVYDGVKVSTNDFSVLFSIISFVASLIMYLCIVRKNNPKLLIEKESLISGIGFAVVHMTGLLIQLIAAVNVPSGLLFPLVTGGTLIFTPILSLIVYKEKIDKMNVICILISFIATVLFAF